MTPTSSGAPDTDKAQLWVVFLSFGIAAPFTSQGTTLHEDKGSNARPIMKREPLDMGYISRNFLIFAEYFAFSEGIFIKHI